jgi:hypothetical protein
MGSVQNVLAKPTKETIRCVEIVVITTTHIIDKAFSDQQGGQCPSHIALTGGKPNSEEIKDG